MVWRRKAFRLLKIWVLLVLTGTAFSVELALPTHVTAATPTTVGLTSPNVQSGGYFGLSVAVSGNIVVIGAPYENSDVGNAYIFNAQTGALVATLSPPGTQSGGNFGFSVAAYGNTVVIGAPSENNNVGNAYIFNAQTGALVATLSPPGTQSGGSFGFSVATESDTVVVGAPAENSTIGCAYVFDGTTGALKFALYSSSAQYGGQFGWSGAVSGSNVVVGAPYQTVDSYSNAGNAYEFDATTGLPIGTLANPNPQGGENFGWSVAMGSNFIAVGAPYASVGGNPGNAYIFGMKSGALMWSLTSPSPQSGGDFGRSVAVSGNAVIVGAPGEIGGGYPYAGNTYILNAETGALAGNLVSPNPQVDGAFGWSVAIFDYYAVVGASSETTGGHANAGSAYIFTIQTQTGVSCTPSPFDIGGTSSCTATVSGGISPTGNVTFSQSSGAGKITFFSACTLVSGSCSVTVTGVSAGSATVLATYLGNMNNLGSSGNYTVGVSKSSPTIFTGLSSSRIVAIGFVFDSATLVGATGGAGGSVTYEYFSGGTCAGPATVVSTVKVTNGAVPNSATKSFNAAGDYSWNAVYSGDTNNNGATSSCEPLAVSWPIVRVSTTTSTITTTTTTTTIPAPVSPDVIQGTFSYQQVVGNSWNFSNPIVCAQSSGVSQCEAADVDLTATLDLHSVSSSGSAQPFSGIVESYGIRLAVCQPTYLSFHTVRSDYAVIGACFDEALVVTQTVVGTVTLTAKLQLPIDVAGPTCNLITAQLLSLVNKAPASESGFISASASVTTGNNAVCAFKYSLAAGSLAEPPSNSSTKESFAVVIHEPTTILCIASPVNVGIVTKCRATVSGNSPTGTVTWTSSGSGTFSSVACTLSRSGFCQVSYRPSSGASPVPVTVTYSGDSRNSRSEGIFPLTVLQKASHTSVSCKPSHLPVGSSKLFTCTAVVKGYHPTGTVTWSQSGAGSVTFLSASCTLSAGKCSVTMRPGSAGQVTVVATYTGDPSNQGSSSSRLVLVKAA